MAGTPILERCLRQAARHLWVVRAVGVFPWSLLAVSAVVAAVLVYAKYRPLGWEPTTILAAGLVASLVAAFVWAWFRGGSRLSAAIELDRRCNLDERVSTAIAAKDVMHDESSAAAAVRADAERALEKVDVAAAFPVVASRRWAVPLLPACAAIALAFWFTPAGPSPEETLLAAENAAKIKESTKSLEKKLDEKKKTAEELKLTEAKELLEKVQEEARRLQQGAGVDQKETLIRLNDLAKQLEERRKSVEVPEELKKQLGRLKSSEPGPAEKLAQSLGKGDFKDAAEQLQKLREQMKSNGLNEEQKAQLEKQLDQLQRQLDEMAKRQEEQRKQAEQQLAEKRDGDKAREGDKGSDGKSGPSAEELAEMSDKLASAAAQSDALEQLQQALEQAAEQSKQGNPSGAQQALDKLQQQLQQMAAQDGERQLLEQGLNDLAECKAQVTGGEGPGQGQQAAAGAGQPGQENGKENGGQGNRPGRGGLKPGVGTARNENPTAEDPSKLFDSRARIEVGPGALRVVGPADGPNAKGKALEAIREQAEALAGGADPQPVANQPLDRSRRTQKREYFDALRQAE